MRWLLTVSENLFVRRGRRVSVDTLLLREHLLVAVGFVVALQLGVHSVSRRVQWAEQRRRSGSVGTKKPKEAQREHLYKA